MRRRGITLLELLIAAVIITVAVGASTRAFTTGLGYEQRFVRSTESRADRAYVEDSVVRLLRGLEITGTGFLVAPIPGDGGPSGATSSGLGMGSSSMSFTTVTRQMPSRYLQSSGDDWRSLNDRFGPQGGPTEIALSTTPAGDAGRLRGLFLRQQTPPDSEPSRGGMERLLSERIKDIRFQFYDGKDWKDAWDSRDSGADKGKAPTAVRVDYLLADETKPHSLIVRPAMASGGSQ